MTEFLWVWLGITVTSLIIEFVSMEMVSIWFVPAGIVAMILNACGVSLSIQIIVFVVLSIILILSFRKLVLKYLNKNAKIKTNAVGDITKLLSSIKDGNPGTIKVNGVVWDAVTEDGSDIEAETKVEVVKLKGNKYIVKLPNEE